MQRTECQGRGRSLGVKPPSRLRITPTLRPLESGAVAGRCQLGVVCEREQDHTGPQVAMEQKTVLSRLRVTA